MTESTVKPEAFWHDVERRIASKTDAVLRADAQARALLIAYLRNVEEMVRAEGGRRQTLQVAASARRVLGDTSRTNTLLPRFAL